MINNFVAPTLKRNGFTYVSHRIVDGGNKIGPWKGYGCYVTAVWDKSDRATIEVGFVVHGGNYASFIVNKNGAVAYIEISGYWDGKRAGGSSDITNDASLSHYLERAYPD